MVVVMLVLVPMVARAPAPAVLVVVMAEGMVVLKERAKTLLVVVLTMVPSVVVMIVLLLAVLLPTLFVRHPHHTIAKIVHRYMLCHLQQIVFRLLLQSVRLPGCAMT